MPARRLTEHVHGTGPAQVAPEIRAVGTLGPAGTDHERAANAYGALRNLTVDLHLLDTLEEGVDYLLGTPGSLLVANSAHPNVDLLSTRSWRMIGIIDIFGLATMPLALVRRSRPSGSGRRIAIMPSTRGYVSLSLFDEVEYVTAKPVALRLLLEGAVDAAIVSYGAYQAHADELTLLEQIGPVECCWMVFGRRTVVPGSVLAPSSVWQDES